MESANCRTGDHPIELNNEDWLPRLITTSNTGREDAFRDGVRSRDGKCVISGLVNRALPNWTTFEAAHVFPLASESYWREHNFDRWITDPNAPTGSFDSKINSVQNGFLLKSDVHLIWDQYLISVNPDVIIPFA